MSLIQLRINASAEAAEQISTALMLLDAEAVTLLDAADQALYEPSVGTTPLWDQVCVCSLFPANTDLQPILNFIAEHITHEPVSYRTEIVEDEDWINKWREHFRSMCFGTKKKLWIFPTDKEAAQSDAKFKIILEPGLAFGTGTHPTTSLCLTWLVDNVQKNDVVIDYGCGSGILAIAALKLGAKEVYAVDYDPQALIATIDNAKRNQIALENIKVVSPNQLPTIPADILVANILANPLIELAPRFSTLVKSGGKIALSGILATQKDNVLQAYQTFIMNECETLEDWVLLAGKL